MIAPILLLAIGNESRGDDALAPLLLRRLQAEALNERIEFLEDFQLQIEHAADLVGRELVLFMDAGVETPAPYSFYRIQPDDGRTVFSHALAPQAVLATFVQVYRANPPPCFVLCLHGEQFELGATLSSEAEQGMAASMEFMQELLREPHLDAWERRLR
ncbi:MAG: hydrogenase maturation protease [Nitrosomonadales bacterium]|nr:hydrogenase maturation protease [Nitrosomonadales bacterium]